MADKLTTQLNKTDKKVEDISKSRLGNTYKNIIRLPDYLTGPTSELVSLTDSIVCSLVNIANPDSFYNEFFHDELAEYQTGTGTYTTNDLTKVMTENNGTLPFKELYSVDVPAGSVGSYVTLRHTKTTNTSSYGYKDVVIKRPSTETTQYRNVIDIPRDIKIVDATTVDITFIPDVAGTYLVGIYMDLYDCNQRMIDPLIHKPATGSCRAVLPMCYTRHAATAYDENYDYDTSVLSSNIEAAGSGKVYWNDSVTTSSVHTSQKDIGFVSHSGSGTIYEYKSEYIVMMDGQDLFFPLKGNLQPNGKYGIVKVIVQNDINNSAPVKWRLVYSDGTYEVERTLSTIWYKETCNKDPIGLIVTGVATADRGKIQVVHYVGDATYDGEYTGYKWFTASDTGCFKGSRFVVDHNPAKGKLYYHCSVKPTVYSITSLGSRSLVTSSPSTTSHGSGIYEFTSLNTGIYELEWSSNDAMVLWSANYGFTGTVQPIICNCTQVPSLNGYYLGTNFVFPFKSLGTLYEERYETSTPQISGTWRGLPRIKLTGGAQDAYVTLTYYNNSGDSSAVNINVPAGTTVTGLEYTSVTKPSRTFDYAVEVSSTNPISVSIDFETSRHTYQLYEYTSNPPYATLIGTLPIHTDGAMMVGRRLFNLPVDHSVSPVYATAKITSSHVIDNYATTVKSWEKTFSVTSSFDGTAYISWKQFSIAGAGNISCYVSYSDDGSTWTTETSIQNDSYMPAAGLSLNTRYIKVRFEIPSNNWLYNIRFVYYTWQAI